jgi:tetratricopeptide (TPR) repeat protein
MSLTAGVRLGAYEIVSPLGTGGMGEVYRARDTRLGRTVAIKILGSRVAADETARLRLIREAKVISSIDHPNICTLYDVGQQEGIDYLVMQYLEGETLAERLRQGPVPIDDAIRFATEIASALAAAHEHGIVHRDLKPGNVMLTATGAKLLDFGLAVARSTYSEAPTALESDHSSQSSLTQPGLVLGTLPYMAPEQLESRPADHRSDIFSFGAVFYEMLTGRRAFMPTAGAGLLTQILGTMPPRPSIVNRRAPASFDGVVLRCLAKAPGDRWQSAREVLAAIDDVAQTSVDRRRFLAIATVIALIVAGIASWAGLRGSRPPSATVPTNGAHVVLAVLPFEVDSADAAERAYWAGLSQAVATKLQNLSASHNLYVASAEAVRAVRSPGDARGDVGATRVVRGHAAAPGGTWKLPLQLVDTRTSATLRTTTVPIDRGDPAASQDAVLEAILTLLDVRLTAGERARLVASRTTAGAYDFYLQGLGYLREYDKPENIDIALTVFDQALKLDPDHAPAHAGIGQAYLLKYTDTRDPTLVASARTACERALGLDENDATPHLCLGQVESVTGRYEKAVEEFEHALERDPGNEVACIRLADTYKALNDNKRAEETYRRAIGMRPGYWLGHSSLGAFYFSVGRFAEAEAAFKQVISLSPDSWRAYSNLGGALQMQEKIRPAADAYEKSMSLRPNYAAASNLGTLYFYEFADYRRAAGSFRRATDLSPGRYDIWGNLGWALKWAGDTPGSRAAFAKALPLAEARVKVNRRDAPALMSLAEYHAELGETAMARRQMEQALSLAPDNARLLYRAGLLHETEFGDRRSALETLRRALQLGHPMRELEQHPSLARLRADGGLATLRTTTSQPAK